MGFSRWSKSTPYRDSGRAPVRAWRLDIECLNRTCLNTYVPILRFSGQVVAFMTRHMAKPIPSSALMAHIGTWFRQAEDIKSRRAGCRTTSAGGGVGRSGLRRYMRRGRPVEAAPRPVQFPADVRDLIDPIRPSCHGEFAWLAPRAGGGQGSGVFRECPFLS